MPTFRIQHLTNYEYNRPITESHNEIRIFPFACEEQEILEHELTITGSPNLLTYTDYWGNKIGQFNLNSPHTELVVESRLVVRTKSPADRNMVSNSGFEQLQREIDQSLQLLELTKPDTILQQEAIQDIVRQIYQPWKSVAATVQDCCQFIYQHFQYIKGITDIETTVDQIIEHRSGVCQDFAHVMLQVLRTIKIPSRYVSGYICPNKNGLRGEGATHAWVETWIPDYGWMGIDPTNNIWVSNNHVKLAVGRNFSDCSPVKGTFKGPARQQLYVYVSVGYEDGHRFEDRTQVMTPSAPEEALQRSTVDEAGREQQQQ